MMVTKLKEYQLKIIVVFTAAVQKTNNMKKDSSFKLRSGNKPSMAQLSGVSPVKDYKKSLKYRLLGKAGQAKMDAKYASGEKTKTQKDVKNVLSGLDKAIQGFFNNPRGKQRTGKDEYVPAKKGGASGGDKGGFKAVTFKGEKGDPYSYRTLEGGGYEYSKDGKKFTKATTKGNKAIDKLFKSKNKK
tara:strand:+ start:698 stop:1258 length:561 start_codon:yes stop_codon:yes gene_type:complete